MKTLIDIITTVIIDQITHNKTLSPELCYNEITNTLTEKQFKGFEICEKVKNPICILKSENFQYLIDDQNKKVQILNKFF